MALLSFLKRSNYYWHFMSRQPAPDFHQLTTIEVFPNFFTETLWWTLFFTGFFLVTSKALKTLFPKWQGSLSSKKQKELPAYIVCLFHHIVRVPNAWIHVLSDFYRIDSEAATMSYCVIEAGVGPFAIGYLTGDLICFAIPEALRGEFEFLIHHVAIIVIVSYSTFQHPYVCRWIPHLLICDTTNLLFNTAWILRTTNLKESFVVKALEIGFAASFLFTRVIHLPVVFLVVAASPYGDGMGWCKLFFLPMVLLQWYWFSKIAVTTLNRLGAGSKAREGVKSSTSSSSPTPAVLSQVSRDRDAEPASQEDHKKK